MKKERKKRKRKKKKKKKETENVREKRLSKQFEISSFGSSETFRNISTLNREIDILIILENQFGNSTVNSSLIPILGDAKMGFFIFCELLGTIC